MRKSVKERGFCRAEQSIFCCALHPLPLLLAVGPCSLASVYKEAYSKRTLSLQIATEQGGGYGVRLSGLDSRGFFFVFL